MKEQMCRVAYELGVVDTDYAGPVLTLDRESELTISDCQEVGYKKAHRPRAVLDRQTKHTPWPQEGASVMRSPSC